MYKNNEFCTILKSGNGTINKIFISKTAYGSNVGEIIKLARQNGIPVNNVPPEKLDKFEDTNTQGIVAEVSTTDYVELSDLIKSVKDKKNALFLLLDSIEDPHNLGAIIRNAVAFGVDGVIVPKWRSATVNDTVSRTSAGAIEHIKIARVTNSSLLNVSIYTSWNIKTADLIFQSIDFIFSLFYTIALIRCRLPGLLFFINAFKRT